MSLRGRESGAVDKGGKTSGERELVVSRTPDQNSSRKDYRYVFDTS